MMCPNSLRRQMNRKTRKRKVTASGKAAMAGQQKKYNKKKKKKKNNLFQTLSWGTILMKRMMVLPICSVKP
ncbi:MAG: hypothetical protein K1W13_14580 [Lachnospiraceae bacterium]